MASETKVGLLAGLAFIICFAVILANRGQSQRHVSETVAAPVLDFERRAVTTDEVSFGRTAPPNSRVDDAVGRVGRRHAHQPQNGLANPERIIDGGYPGPTVSGSEIDWAPSERTPVESMVDTTRTDRAGPTADRGDSAGSALRTDSALTASQDTRDAAALEALLNRPGRTGAASEHQTGLTRTADRAPAENPRPVLVDDGRKTLANAADTRPGQSYTVKPGDTLTAIARRTLGSADRRNLDAILDANRAVLSDPDLVKVGMSLVIPAIGASMEGSARREASQGQESRLVSDRAQSTASIRWYQVRKNDRYASIAREQLGDAGRWQELYELNKDKFPDPDRIREGVRIKLPQR